MTSRTPSRPRIPVPVRPGRAGPGAVLATTLATALTAALVALATVPAGSAEASQGRVFSTDGPELAQSSGWPGSDASSVAPEGAGSEAPRVNGLIVRFRTAVESSRGRLDDARSATMGGAAVRGVMLRPASATPAFVDFDDDGQADDAGAHGLPLPGGEAVVDVDPATGHIADPAAATRSVSDRAGVPVAFGRLAAEGLVVVRLPSPVPADIARDVAQRLMADPTVESVTPDIMVRSMGSADPLAASQWNLPQVGALNAGLGAMNVTPLWSWTRGLTRSGEPIVVAVLDSGRTAHPDLESAWIGGYDFISAGVDGSLTAANDGDGRDADPSDPGNACPTTASGSYPSTWHGTRVAGIIAAAAENGIGGVGAAPATRILPVRVLGRCGGRLSDTLDAMLWAAGIPVPGVPDNPHPAKVINLSLASDEAQACTSDTSTLVQDVVDRILARNVLIVAAAGNDGELAGYPKATGSVGVPANCRGVLGVAAHTRSGDLAAYSSYGADVTLTAPGGAGGSGRGCKRQTGVACQTPGIITTTNSGRDAPGLPDYITNFVGTSAATPHVAAAAALLYALRPEASPQDITAALASSARPWPTGTFCASADGKGLCGTGMLDARAAATHLITAPRLVVERIQGPLPGGLEVQLNATASSDVHDASAMTWAWRQISGAPASLAGDQGARPVVTLPPRRSQVVIEARVTDPAGLSTFVNVVLDVNNAPVAPAIESQRLLQGARLERSLAGVDADGDSIRYALIRGAADMTVDPHSGLFAWTGGAIGEHPVVVSLTDAHGARGVDLAFTIVVEDPAAQAAAAQRDRGAGGGGSAGVVELALLGLALVAGRRRLHGEGRRDR